MFIRRTRNAIGIVFIVQFIILFVVIFFITKGCMLIRDHGAKNIITRIWEGPQPEHSPTGGTIIVED